MTANEIRKKYIEFFVKRGHKEISPAPIIPPDDPTTLFTNSGMQQLVPYLKGEPHPMGKRLVDSQPCFRAEDIEEVGDNRHTTFYEMLGNWSLGDYFKKEQLTWNYEFLTKVIGLDPKRLYVSVFAGSKIAPKDQESIKIWQKLFQSKEPAQLGEKGFNLKTKIYLYDASKNWWSRVGVPENMPTGEVGGTTSEVFFDNGQELKFHQSSQFKGKACHINCDCGRFLEICNSVFMEYEKQKDGSFDTLPEQNVDFGGGLERITAVSQGKSDVFQSDLFQPIFKAFEEETTVPFDGQAQAMRRIADHFRGAVMMGAEGIIPSNKEQGYFMRRLIRRAMISMRQTGIDYSNTSIIEKLTEAVAKIYQKPYPHVQKMEANITQTIIDESKKFSKVLSQGIKKLEELKSIDGKQAFNLYQSYGLPLEITQELLEQMGKTVNEKQFQKEFRQHQEISRAGAEKKFKGGLADQKETTTKLHTATHLLHKALREILGDHVRQEGSNITAKRLRFDFSHSKSLTAQEIKKIENLINLKIEENLPVHKTLEDKEKALESGALAFFKETYPVKVSVYTIGRNPNKNWYSKELCGGPHVKLTRQIGGIKILKEKSIGTGLRRIYAKLK
jgi:alanyl-tRNA synthetase